MKIKTPKFRGVILTAFIVIVSMALIVLGFLTLKNCDNTFGGIFIALTVAILTISVTLSCYIIWKLVKDADDADNYKARVNDYEQIITELRAQRHDFQNHLAVISTLLQMGAYDNAMQYMSNMLNNVNSLFSVGTLKKPEIAAVLISKIDEANKKGIDVELDITASLEGIQASALDIVRILSNLMDNAIYELSHQPSPHKKLFVSIKENELYAIFTVINNVPVIPSDIRERIWQKGFTTKGHNGEGLGLYVIKKLVDKNGGRILFNSDEQNGTVFQIMLPLSQNI
ncbi:MAG: hypothetical protein PWQ93_1106 [Clostridiales bacterium]|nr:hypothetical protein [Clostridiales bacterium]